MNSEKKCTTCLLERIQPGVKGWKHDLLYAELQWPQRFRRRQADERGAGVEVGFVLRSAVDLILYKHDHHHA